MRKALALLTITLLAPAGLGILLGAAAAKKKAPAKTAAKPGTKKKTAASKKSSPRRRTAKSTRQTWRTRQLTPTPERYQEIQQALIKKGYLQGPGTGHWDQDSIDALRRFQQDQHLDASGKINSLSLIALGLGPRYDTAAAPPPSQPPK